MELIENINEISKPFRNAVVTIGNFDGVHKGHQALLHQTIKKAEEIKGTSVAITFEPHPLRVLGYKSPSLITRKDQKIELISATGVDKIICIPFTKEFACISAENFINEFLIKKIGIKAIIIGSDYSFGKNRKGNIAFLKKKGKDADFEVIISDWVNDSESQKHRISSTKIRDLVIKGKVDKVINSLGRFYQIRGKVIKGRKRGGAQVGFPTANIKLHDELCPKIGVYAVQIECIKGNFNGVANIGYSPTFKDNIFTIEVHLFDFSEDIYNTRIRVNMIKRLRDEKKFSNIKELSAQIKEDINQAKKILMAL